MLIYLIPFTLLTVLTVGEILNVRLVARQEKILFAIIIILLIGMAGFRYGIESDYWHYYDIFYEKIKTPTIELGFKYFTKIVYLISNSYVLYCFILAFISIAIKGKLFIKYKYYFLVLFVYYTRFFLMFEMNTVRQGFALCFTMAALIAFSEHDLKRYFLFVLIGTLFHTSTIVILLVFLIDKIRLDTVKMITIGFGISILFRLFLFNRVINGLSFLIPIVSNTSNSLVSGLGYIVNSGDKMNVVTVLSFVRIIVPVYCLLFLNRDKKSNIMIKCYFVGAILNIVLSGLDTIPTRIATEFYCTEGFILSEALDKRQNRRKYRIDVSVVPIFIIMALDISTFFGLLCGSSLFIPYKSIFFK